MDAFIQAFTIPNVFRRLTAEGSMTLAFLPLYTEIREQRSAEEARLFAARVLGLVLAGTGMISALGILFSPQLVWLFAAGFADDPEKFALTSALNRVMFPYLILVSVVAWAMGVLNAEKRFAAPAAAPLFLNVAIIVAAWGFSDLFSQPIEAVAWGVLFGGLAQVILQLPSLQKITQPVRPRAFWRNADVRRLLRLLGPSLLGVAVYQLNIIILRNLASFLPEGQVTYYYNASRLTELVLGVFAFAITTASFPDLSAQQARDESERVLGTLRTSLLSTLFIVLPATAGLIGLAEPIVSMLYRHGAFTWADVQITAETLQAFALSIPAVALVRLVVSLFYALQDTKTPVRASLFSLVLTTTLGWWWSQSLQVVGLALALSVGTFAQLGALLWFLKKRPFALAQIWEVRAVGIYVGGASVLGGMTWFGSQWRSWEAGPFAWSNWFWFLTLISSAALFYLLLLWRVRDEQLRQLLRSIRR